MVVVLTLRSYNKLVQLGFGLEHLAIFDVIISLIPTLRESKAKYRPQQILFCFAKQQKITNDYAM